jgi:hypothetical protein
VTHARDREPGRRAWRGIALALGAALAAVIVLRLPASWESGNSLNHVSGAWMALADDLAHGTFYRPLADPALGYGGTRFFPLAFTLHAALLHAGLPLFTAGRLLALAEGLAAFAGAAWFLRRAGLDRWPAAALAVLPLAGFSGQFALGAVRGDLLAAALSIWALGWLLPARGPSGRAGLAPAALLLVLGFLAKPTSVAAIAAAVAFLALRGERRRALALGLAVGAGCVVAVAAVDFLSSGRFLALLGLLGPGGAGPSNVVHAPLRLAEVLVREDPAGLALLAAAAVALPQAIGPPRLVRPAVLLAALWAGAALLATVGTLASPGTGVNHLLDLEGPAALLASAALAGGGTALGGATVALAAAAGLATAAAGWHRDLTGGRLAQIRGTLEAAAGDGPVLSEDPLVPLRAGERPYLVDSWAVRLAATRDPEIARLLLERLRSGGFRAVVLLDDADAPDADEWFSRDLGPAALAEIRAAWRPAASTGPYHVYRYVGPPPDGSPRPLLHLVETGNNRTRP